MAERVNPGLPDQESKRRKFCGTLWELRKPNTGVAVTITFSEGLPSADVFFTLKPTSNQPELEVSSPVASVVEAVTKVDIVPVLSLADQKAQLAHSLSKHFKGVATIASDVLAAAVDHQFACGLRGSARQFIRDKLSQGRPLPEDVKWLEPSVKEILPTPAEAETVDEPSDIEPVDEGKPADADDSDEDPDANWVEPSVKEILPTPAEAETVDEPSDIEPVEEGKPAAAVDEPSAEADAAKDTPDVTPQDVKPLNEPSQPASDADKAVAGFIAGLTVLTSPGAPKLPEKQANEAMYAYLKELRDSAAYMVKMFYAKAGTSFAGASLPMMILDLHGQLHNDAWDGVQRDVQGFDGMNQPQDNGLVMQMT